MDNDLAEYLGDIKQELGALRGSQEGTNLTLTLMREDMNRRFTPLENEKRDRRRDDWISSILTFVAAVVASWLGMKPHG